MEISRQEVLHVARLARLGLDEDEIAKFSSQLSKLLESFQVLQETDTTDVPPTTQITTLHDVTRRDEPQESLAPEQILANAPQKEGDFFRVRPVLG